MSTTFHPHFLGFFYIYKVPLFSKNMCPFQKLRKPAICGLFGKRLQYQKRKIFAEKCTKFVNIFDICVNRRANDLSPRVLYG